MGQGIRATVAFTGADVCPIVAASTADDATVRSVSRSVPVADGTPTVTEFAVDGSADQALPADVEPVFEYGSTRLYRRTHGDSVTCPCECLGELGCPPARYDVRDGRLTLVFHASDYDALQATVGALRDRFPDLDIKRFLKDPSGDPETDAVFVDRSTLTDRQREVLETALEMGYFAQPRRANATEVADALDIGPSTFTEHLAAAQRKLLGAVLEER